MIAFTPLSRKIFILLFVGFSFLWGLGQAPLFDEDEAFFAEGTREMVLRNDFISTFVNQEQRFDKPPLTNWLQYASTAVLGWNEMAIRLPSALAALLWMYFIYYFTKRKLGERAAFFATLIAASSLQITIIGKAALADSLLNACLAGTMFSLYKGSANGSKYWVWIGYFLSAIGFLAKGPIALLVPGSTFVLYILLHRQWKLIPKLLSPLGILIFLLIAGPWYLLAYQTSGMRFIEGFFLSHNVNRFQTAFEGHYGSIWYFVPILLLGLMPFTGVILQSLRPLGKLFSDRWFSFLLIWFLFVFVLFSLSGTKLHHYIIYGYTPLCVIGGKFMEQNKRPVMFWPSILLLIILATIPFVLPFVTNYIQDEYALDVMKGAASVFGHYYILWMAGLVIILVGVWWSSKAPLELRATLLGLVFLVTINVVWMPRLGLLLQMPVKEAALVAQEKGLTNIIVLNHYTPSFHFYSKQFASERKPEPGETVFARKASLDMKNIAQVYYEKYGLILARLKE
ncbi:ArnT family glycosyltransferase [Dyadobacter tibetensis]|uniref:ArnT family glycosyltransferase n=1 Tax=Dyadobacter tibetensis TaxID=1211851 RepID=UPI0004BCEDBC|nr:glycosyltransferase family 39 protein [Dyadobacter tibetensis]